MSYEAMDWVCEQAIKDPQAKYVLLMIAKHADNLKWQAFPSAQRLSLLTGLNERTVRRKLLDLKKGGYIFVETRNVGGRQSSNMMTICRKGGQRVRSGRAERPPNKSSNKINNSIIRGAERPPKKENEIDWTAMGAAALGVAKSEKGKGNEPK